MASDIQKILIYPLAVAVQAYTLSRERKDIMVAAILATKDGELQSFGNDEEEVVWGNHAEENAIVAAKGSVRGGTMVVSTQPCFFKRIVKLEETPDKKTIIGTIMKTSAKADELGKQIIWQKTKEAGTEVHYTRDLFNTGVKIQALEQFQGNGKSTVYWWRDSKWLPREVRQYYTVDNVNYVLIKEGCSVMMALLNFKEVFYLYDVRRFKEGLKFLKSHRVYARDVEQKNKNLKRIAALVADNKYDRTEEIAEEMARLSYILRIDVVGQMKNRFGIEVRKAV